MRKCCDDQRPTATDLVDGNRPVTCASALGSGGLGSGDTFPLGTTTVRCTASDTRGNSDHVEFAVTVQDTTPPALHDVPGNITTEATGPDGAPVSFSPPTATDLVDGTTPVHCDVPPGDTFALGVSTVACTSTDHAGNEASASFTVTVQDTTAPDVTVPGNQTVEATGPHGATSTWTGVRARDLVDGDLDATCDPASGSIFALGVATVDCAATDAHHNTGHGGFTVTVQDTTAPVVTVPGAKTVEATGPAGAHVAFTASASDLVDGAVPVDCTAGGQPVSSGDTFPLGQTTVSCIATDSHDNTSATKTFTVTVTDTTAPQVTVPGNKTVEATGPAGAAVSFTASANDLVDGTVTPTCVPPSGATFPLGTTTVTCSATDAHANTGTDSFTVTVVDTTAPTLTLPGNLTATATSAAGAAVGYTATASDLVDGPVTPSCVPAPGATSPRAPRP